MERDEYILTLKKKPKVNMGGCRGCIERNGSISLYHIICPFPIIYESVLYSNSHVCTCSSKECN